MNRSIHVVAFQRPYPPTYGGVIDMYFRLKALHDLGLHVILHTFAYRDRMAHATELYNVADEVFYYERKTGIKSQFSLSPYIVVSRRNGSLLNDLLKDDAPILFEGLHSTYYLNHPLLKSRYKIVRAHNIEHRYYMALAFAPGTLYDRFYYLIEAFKLRLYEPVMRNADLIASINTNEAAYFKERYQGVSVKFIPAFFDDTLPPVEATGNYVLYHGNLTVAENVKAAIWIVEKIAGRIPWTQFVIAGYDPPADLISMVNRCGNVSLVHSPSEEEMESLISSAKMHLLITFQPTGVKLKLLHVLSRHGTVVANSDMVAGTGLDNYCIIADTPDEICDKIRDVLSSSGGVSINGDIGSIRDNAIEIIKDIPYYHDFCMNNDV